MGQSCRLLVDGILKLFKLEGFVKEEEDNDLGIWGVIMHKSASLIDVELGWG